MGSIAGASSGDLFVAFSTTSTGAAPGVKVRRVEMLDDMAIDPVYEAVVQGTEEAVLNAMLAATTMTGANWLRVPALPHDRLRQVLAKAGRLKP
jgi:L-aminopeptidase/D-esterase-like protein